MAADLAMRTAGRAADVAGHVLQAAGSAMATVESVSASVSRARLRPGRGVRIARALIVTDLTSGSEVEELNA